MGKGLQVFAVSDVLLFLVPVDQYSYEISVIIVIFPLSEGGKSKPGWLALGDG